MHGKSGFGIRFRAFVWRKSTVRKRQAKRFVHTVEIPRGVPTFSNQPVDSIENGVF